MSWHGARAGDEKLNINGIKYENVSSDSKDRSFVTVVYNKVTKKVEIFSRPPEFLAPVFDVETIDEPPDQLPVNFLNSVCSTSLYIFTNTCLSKASAATPVPHDPASVDQKPTDLANFTTERSQRKQLLPPYSITAKVPVDAYPLREFAPPSCFSALREEAMSLAGADAATCRKWLAESTYPHFILDRLNYLPVDEKNSTSSANSTARKRPRKDAAGANHSATRSRLDVATSLALLSHMFRLFKLRPRDLQQKQPLARTPPPVARHLLNEFTIMMAREGLERVKVRTMTPTLRDKLLYHIVILLLHCDDFTTTIDDLTVDFKLPSDRLKKYFVFVGCRLSKQDPSKDADSADKSSLEASSRPKTIARLMTPLVFKDAKPLAYKR
ncbi:DNA-directed RNA polymerase I subunit RPA49 [Sparganum proliferum]